MAKKSPAGKEAPAGLATGAAAGCAGVAVDYAA